jgi:hypothetical protein
MTQLETNKLIAKFMGATVEQWYPENKLENMTGEHAVYPKGKYPENQSHHPVSCLKYHTSYDWLIKVVEQIELLPAIGDTRTGMKGAYKLSVDPWDCEFVDFSDATNPVISTAKRDESPLIDCLYYSVVNFITWYNINSPK